MKKWDADPQRITGPFHGTVRGWRNPSFNTRRVNSQHNKKSPPPGPLHLFDVNNFQQLLLRVMIFVGDRMSQSRSRSSGIGAGRLACQIAFDFERSNAIGAKLYLIWSKIPVKTGAIQKELIWSFIILVPYVPHKYDRSRNM